MLIPAESIMLRVPLQLSAMQNPKLSALTTFWTFYILSMNMKTVPNNNLIEFCTILTDTSCTRGAAHWVTTRWRFRCKCYAHLKVIGYHRFDLTKCSLRINKGQAIKTLSLLQPREIFSKHTL